MSFYHASETKGDPMNWTPDRPTKPGKYHVYVAPKNRSRLYPGYLIVTLDSHDLEDLDRNELYAGAQWLPYVEPPDPFAEPVPSLRERVEALPRFDPAASRRLPHMQPTADGLFLARSDVLALFKVPR